MNHYLNWERRVASPKMEHAEIDVQSIIDRQRHALRSMIPTFPERLFFHMDFPTQILKR